MNRLILIILLLLSQTCLAQQGYLKLVRSGDGEPKKLQTGIARFTSPSGQVVDLVSVIHVGDKSYYERLNKHFKGYQSVLYEMVLDVPRSVEHQNEIRELLGREKKEPKIDTSKGGRDPVSRFQQKLAEILAMKHQMEVIDYSVDNFRHADLTLEEFEEAMAEKKASPLAMLKSLFQADDEETPPEYKKILKLPILSILARGPKPQERHTIKVGLAAYFAQYRDIGKDVQGEVLIGLRNKKAIEVLEHRLGKGDKKVAIFYGAAHMPDFSTRLKKMGFKAVSRNWISAWSLK